MCRLPLGVITVQLQGLVARVEEGLPLLQKLAICYEECLDEKPFLAA